MVPSGKFCTVRGCTDPSVAAGEGGGNTGIYEATKCSLRAQYNRALRQNLHPSVAAGAFAEGAGRGEETEGAVWSNTANHSSNTPTNFTKFAPTPPCS